MTANLVYERIPTETLLDDAITVAIHSDADGKTLAWVKWGPWIGDGVHQHGDFEGPLPVRKALDRGTELAPLYGFDRVVVFVDDFSLWHADWGTLVSTGTMPAAAPRGIESEAADEMPAGDDAARTSHILDI